MFFFEDPRGPTVATALYTAIGPERDLADRERDLADLVVLDQMVVVVLAKVLTTDRLLADRFLVGEAEEVRHQFHQSRNQSV